MAAWLGQPGRVTFMENDMWGCCVGNVTTSVLTRKGFEEDESHGRCRFHENLLGNEGSKPSRGKPNPEGGTKMGVETRRTSGPSFFRCVEGTRSP